MNIAVLGAVWGDEGKGRIVHHFSKDYDWVIRFGGGANAGHTIYRDGKKFVHNLLPSVDYRNPAIKSYLGAGMVIDLEKLRDEIYIAEKSFPNVSKTIYVDKDAFLVESKHKEEDKATNGHIGSTNRGIGPAYKDKIGRTGYRIGDLYHGGRLHDPYYDDFMYQLVGRGVNFVSSLELRDEMMQSNLLFEGAQGIMLDLNHGVYPYVSCGDATLAGVHASGFGFAKIDKVYGVAKAYTTKVGAGPFPTEIVGQEADELRERGQEYGATTGRPRRVGWIDLPALKYACQKGNINSLIITKMDILDGMDKVTACHAYDKPPMCPADFHKAKPQYTSIPGWEDATSSKEAADFIKLIENSANCPVEYVSCGVSEKDILSC